MLDLTEKLLQSHPIYNGRIIRVRRDEVLLPDGGHGLREVVDHPGGAGILALDDKGQVALVRQYRYAVGEHLWEIPAGKREKGEEPRITARRELHEEVALTPKGGRTWGHSSLPPAATLSGCTCIKRRG